MILIKNADVYAPEHLGKKDLLIEGSKIALVADKIELGASDPELVDILDFTGKKLVPGFVDAHVHITGGGGEGGVSNRVPAPRLSDFIRYGVTTVLGLLGTDGISRSLENLYATARSLTEEGISCYMQTGSYRYPSLNITGSVDRDIFLLDRCIGVKVAISDHRSTDVTAEELIRLGTDARMGGVLSGKAGLVTVHVGGGKGGLKPVLEAVKKSDLPPKTFHPTHISNRSEEFFKDAAELTRLGVTIDFSAATTYEKNAVRAGELISLLNDGIDEDKITISSDAFGSLPRFDKNGNTIGITYATADLMPQMFRALALGSAGGKYREAENAAGASGAGAYSADASAATENSSAKGARYGETLQLEKALIFVTKNPARVMGLEGVKGELRAGLDADILALDDELKVTDVFAMGRPAMIDGELIMKGKFEE